MLPGVMEETSDMKWINEFLAFNPLSANPTKWSNNKHTQTILQQFVDKLFNHYVGLGLKELIQPGISKFCC